MATKPTTDEGPEESGPKDAAGSIGPLSPIDVQMIEDAGCGWVEAARLGRTNEARIFLTTCVKFLAEGRVPPRPVNAFLVELLTKIRDAENLWGVPLLSRKPGQKSADAHDNDYAVAHLYWMLTVKRGMKGTAAKKQVAELFELREADVMNRWRKFKAQLKK